MLSRHDADDVPARLPQPRCRHIPSLQTHERNNFAYTTFSLEIRNLSSALRLSAGRHEVHPVRRKTECWYVSSGADLTAALYTLEFRLSLSSSLAAEKSTMVCHSGTGLSRLFWKLAV